MLVQKTKYKPLSCWLSGVGAHRNGQVPGANFALFDYGVGTHVDLAVAAAVVPYCHRDWRHRMAGRRGVAPAVNVQLAAHQQARDQLVPAARPQQTLSFLG